MNLRHPLAPPPRKQQVAHIPLFIAWTV